MILAISLLCALFAELPLAGQGLDEALPRGRAERQAERAERASRTRQSA